METKNKITNGTIILFIGLIHIVCAFMPYLYGRQFLQFSKFYFFHIKMDYESFAAFWFLYFGLALALIGLAVHFPEKERKILPKSFIILYFIFVLIGCYMIPFSGMTYFMLPHAIYMSISNYLKARKLKRSGL